MSDPNLTRDIRAPWSDQYGLGIDKNSVTPFDSGYRMLWNTPSGQRVEGFQVDTDGIPRIGHEAINPMRKTVTFVLAANGSLRSQSFFIADRAYTIQGITYVHKTAGNDAGAVVCNVTKDTGTQAPAAGSSLQTGTFNCKGTANVVQTAVLADTVPLYLTTPGSVLSIAVGDRLSVFFSGTLTTLAGIVITVSMTPSGKQSKAYYYVNGNADLSTQTFYIANRDMVITGVQAIWSTPFAAAVTVDITKDVSTNAPGAGTSVLAAAMDGTTAANTLLTPALAATAATLKMAAGDRLAVKYSATTTGVGVCIVVQFAPVYGRKEVTFQLGPNAQQQVAQCFWIADRDYEVIDVSAVHATAAGGAATIKITIDKGTTAPGGGTSIHGGSLSFNLNATANTVQIGDSTGATLLTVQPRARLMSAGDRLGINIASGAAQSLANLCLTVSLIPR